jgi:DNA-directed RNA polymerase specialized sigma24 family protein
MISQRDYDAFALHYIDGLSVHEVAERLNTTESQVWSSNSRTKQKFLPLLARRLNRGR